MLNAPQGVDVNEDKIRIYADVIQERLGLNCSALSGANIANEGKLGDIKPLTLI